MIKAQIGFDEDDPPQPETQTCPTIELKQEGREKSPVFAWRLYSNFDISLYIQMKIVYFIPIK